MFNPHIFQINERRLVCAVCYVKGHMAMAHQSYRPEFRDGLEDLTALFESGTEFLISYTF